MLQKLQFQKLYLAFQEKKEEIQITFIDYMGWEILLTVMNLKRVKKGLLWDYMMSGTSTYDTSINGNFASLNKIS